MTASILPGPWPVVSHQPDPREQRDDAMLAGIIQYAETQRLRALLREVLEAACSGDEARMERVLVRVMGEGV